MKSYDKMLVIFILFIAILFTGTNIALSLSARDNGNRLYMVEISRLCRQLESGEIPILTDYSYVTGIEKYSGSEDFFNSDGCYLFREIDGSVYRFTYIPAGKQVHTLRVLLNTVLLVLSTVFLGALLYLRRQLLKPFDKLVNVPYELAKGNLTAPLKENRSRFFGRFVWGINMLRETMEEQKQRELSLQKEKQTLLLSISHDIKTPLSAIKLYASALSKGLYKNAEKQLEISSSINEKADEIERFVSELSRAASRDFLQLDVNLSEFYLSEAIKSISAYYTEKLALNKTRFTVESFSDCIVAGDIDRSIEVLQNIMENAIKYGDGGEIRIGFSSEEDGRLVTVSNSGSSLPESELIHVFDSFWRGSNSNGRNGSGLGLYICRQLMLKMNGDIFAEIIDREFRVTVVFRMA